MCFLYFFIFFVGYDIISCDILVIYSTFELFPELKPLMHVYQTPMVATLVPVILDTLEMDSTALVYPLLSCIIFLCVTECVYALQMWMSVNCKWTIAIFMGCVSIYEKQTVSGWEAAVVRVHTNNTRCCMHA